MADRPFRRIAAVGVMIVLAMAAAACDAGSNPAQSTPQLEISGTAWQLVGIGDQALPKGAAVTIQFTASDASGSGGCNRYSGSYQLDGATGGLTFGPLRSTKMACLDDALTGLETAFLGALGATSTATIDVDGLLVLAGAGPRLVFARAPSG